jgi:hypothetical protein
MVIKREDTRESEMFGTEEALAKISMELLDPAGEKLYTVTDVTPVEIFSIPSMLAMANMFNSDLARDWIKTFLQLRISRLRAGRTEFVIVLSGIREFSELKKKGKVGDLFAGLT